jgi:archaellum component FlaF (FlaF/FlaG flagellin family)
MKNNKTKYLVLIVSAMMSVGLLTSCEEEEYERIQYIKKTLGPFIVGQSYDFAFSIASGDNSVLKDVEIEASYPGASGTNLDKECYWTDPSGKDFNEEMLQNISMDGKTIRASVSGNKTEYRGGYNSYAITLRYKYVVPEDARGKIIRFIVRYTTQNGAQQEYSTENYEVNNMDLALNIILTDPENNSGVRYFSISDLRAYTMEEAASKSASVDFVYRYNSSDIVTSGGSRVRLNHSFIAPAHPLFLNTDYVPANWTKNNTCIEVRKWDDMQLRGAVPNNYVTDRDIRDAEMKGVSTAEYNLAANFGMLIQTADGAYRAYVYVKSVNNANRSVTLGIKSLKMK